MLVFHLVASNGSCLEHVQMLIDAGADANIQNNMMQGLLHILKKKGSPITEKDEDYGEIGDGHGGVLKRLLERG